jgi:hypothetical protein
MTAEGRGGCGCEISITNKRRRKSSEVKKIEKTKINGDKMGIM